MGAYLSQPNVEKISSDEFNEYLNVGSSSMQGWRNSQEDAHNSILEYDSNTSFFAVYDGHGGAEVAAYCAANLPTFLKTLTSYENSNLESALREAFMGFDLTLLEPIIIDVLRTLAGDKNGTEDSDGHDEDDVEDLVELHEESHLPLHEVLQKYKGGTSMPILKELRGEDAESGGSKPQSPYLRGRRAAAVVAEAANKAAMNTECKPAGSSTSAAAAALAAQSAANILLPTDGDSGPGPSCFKAKIVTMDGIEPIDDSTVSSSSSSSTSKSSNTDSGSDSNQNSELTNEDKEQVTNGDPKVAATSSSSSTLHLPTNSMTTPQTQHGTSTSNQLVSPDSSHTTEGKETDQNGSVVTSSEQKLLKGDVSTSVQNEYLVSGSNEALKKKQNGTVVSSSSAVAAIESPSKVTTAGISSTSKTSTTGTTDDDEEDADYEVENSSAEENEANDDETTDEEFDSEGPDEDDECNEVSVKARGEEFESTDEEIDYDDDDLPEGACRLVMDEEPGKDSGCTAVVALLRGRDLYVANAGDSRCVVSRNGQAIDMSLDHKPEDEEESRRIAKAGGRVTFDGRVNGGLNLSRAIGDHAYKMNTELPPEEQMITALPDIKKLIINPEDEFMILACDGIWNYMSSEEVVDFVRLRLKDPDKKISEICEELFDNCLAPNTSGDGTGCDNMTAVIIRFKPKILELETHIDPAEIEDSITMKATDELIINTNHDVSMTMSIKRRSIDDNNSNENVVGIGNECKRMKTDEDQNASNNVNSSSGSDSNSSSSTTTAKSVNSTYSNDDDDDDDANSTTNKSSMSSQADCSNVASTTTNETTNTISTSNNTSTVTVSTPST